jgi:aldehyde dehydrogenase (NAD+)
MQQDQPNVSVPQELKSEIHRIFALQKQHQWEVGRTTARERIAKLKRLHQTILDFRKPLEEALWADLRKGQAEVSISELGVVLHEIRFAIQHLASWMTPKRVGSSLPLFRSHSEIVSEPKGVCLILAPWNFPFNLTFDPLVSAIAAGNCVILKPSEYSPNTNRVMREIVEQSFPPGEVSIFEGDYQVARELLSLPFNHIFFTGSPAVGKLVMRAAAEHLSSVTLELGGKSPVIVDEKADLDKAASKIAWLKVMNAGQTCIAPDYLLVHESIHDALVEKLKVKLKQFYGNTPEQMKATPDMCRMISPRHFQRVKFLMDDALQSGSELAFGGETDVNDLYIAPSLLTRVPEAARLWEEEIFGPLLPVRTYRELSEAIDYINAQPKALALYMFSDSNRNIRRILAETRCGGVTVNDCGPHFYNTELPFGGSNNSGIGKCHGEFSFQEFSNQKGVLYQAKFLPVSDFFHPPYGGKLRGWLLEGLVKWF